MTLDSVVMENNFHTVRYLDMKIKDSDLINYHLIFNGTGKTDLRKLFIQKSKLQSTANSMQSVSLDIAASITHFHHVQVYDAHQQQPTIHIQGGGSSNFTNCTISGNYVHHKKASIIKVNNSACLCSKLHFSW